MFLASADKENVVKYYIEENDSCSVKYDGLLNLDITISNLDYLLNRLVGKGLLKQDLAMGDSTLIMNRCEYSLTGIAKKIFQNLDYIVSFKHT